MIQAFVDQEREYREQGSKVLFIFPQDQQGLEDQNGKDYILSGLPEEVRARMLLDPKGNTRRVYTGLMSANLVRDDDTIIFVLDAYGAPYTAVIDVELDSAEIHKEILSWLQYINIQCPE
jgi:hypothetical protein